MAARAGRRASSSAKALLVGLELALQPLQRLGGIAGQPVGIAAVLFQPLLLPVEVGEPLLRRFELAGKRRHAVAVGAGIVAPVGELVAHFGELFRPAPPAPSARRLRRLLAGIDLAVCAPRLLARRLGSGGGIAPAGEQQPRLGDADLVGQRLVALGLLRLPPQAGDLAVEPGHEVFEPGKVGLGLAQLALGIAAADVEAGDPRRLFQHHPPFGRLGGDHLGDLALADQRGGVRAGGCIGEDQRHVLGAHVAAVDAIGAARAALDPAGDLEFLAVGGDGVQHDFGEVARRALRGAGEDDVFHPARAHRLGRVFAHHPADRFEQVGLAAAIGPDDAGQPGFDAQFSRFDEALEA